MKALAFRLSLLAYALLPASLQFKARNLYRKFRPGTPAVDAASLWAEYLDQNVFERVKKSFDARYYSNKYEVSEEKAWTDYLDVGVPLGRFINIEHETSIESGSVSATAKKAEISFTLHSSNENPIPIPTSVEQHSIFDVDLLTIDLWDTLIRRNRPADAPKLATARRILQIGWSESILQADTAWDIFDKRVAIEARIARSKKSQEYELTEVLTELLRELGFTRSIEDLAKLLVSIEVDEEIAWSEVIQDVVEFVNKVQGKKYIASDFYLNSSELNKIVAHLIPELVVSGVHSSCELEASKRVNGELFHLIRSEEKVDAGRHLHIGDNLVSDIRNQVETGGKAVHVAGSDVFHAGPGQFSKKLISQTFKNLDSIVTRETHTSEAFLAGRMSSQFAVALVAGSIEEALRQGVDVVHYISREGYFLQQIHEQIAPIISQHKKIDSRHLTVSRRATFGPSLDFSSIENLISDLGRLWSMYGNQSVEALLVSIGLDAESYLDSLNSFEIGMQEKVPNLGSDYRFINWINDPDVAARIKKDLQTNRSALLAYLDKSMTINDGKVVVADIGWRGSIQDNIGRLFSETEFHGVYLGLFPFLNEQLALHTKKAIIFDGNKGEKYFYAEPPAAIERPWTPHIPSVVKFNKDESGEVFAVTEIEEGDVSNAVKDFQAGSIHASEIVAKWMVAHGYTTSDLRDELQARLENYYLEPSSAVAGIWFDSSHDDSFGALNQTSFLKLRPDRTWIENPDLEIISEAQKNSLWPHGYAAWKPVRSLLALLPRQNDGI